MINVSLFEKVAIGASQRPIIEEDNLKLPIIGVCQQALFNQKVYYNENGIILKRKPV